MPTATILVPGITGTTLVETYGPGFDTVWSAIQKMFESIEDLELNADGTHDVGKTNLIRPGIAESLAYGECLVHLRKKLRHPVYIFRYDWRLDNLETARRLGDYVDLIRKKCGRNTKVNFITHSMGGLVFLAWLGLRNRNPGVVKRAVITVPPLQGAAIAASSLIIGESGPLYLNSSTKFRKVSRSFPSVYQLVGFYTGSFKRNGQDLSPPECWNVDNWQQRTTFRYEAQKKSSAKKLALMKKHLEGAQAFHENHVFDLDSLDDESRKRFVIMYGTGVKTADQVTIKDANSSGDVKNFFDFSAFKPPKGDGDGTVPKQSVHRFKKVEQYEIPVDIHSTWYDPMTYDDAAKIKVAGYHGAFLGLDKNLSIIRSFLSGYVIDEKYLHGIRP